MPFISYLIFFCSSENKSEIFKILYFKFYSLALVRSCISSQKEEQQRFYFSGCKKCLSVLSPQIHQENACLRNVIWNKSQSSQHPPLSTTSVYLIALDHWTCLSSWAYFSEIHITGKSLLEEPQNFPQYSVIW